MFAAVLIAFAEQISRIIYNSVYRGILWQWEEWIINPYMLGGLMHLAFGLIACMKLFSGRKGTLILLALMGLTVWNIIWVSFTNIDSI